MLPILGTMLAGAAVLLISGAVIWAVASRLSVMCWSSMSMLRIGASVYLVLTLLTAYLLSVALLP